VETGRRPSTSAAADYFTSSAQIFTGCSVTPLLDGAEFTAALADALERVGRAADPQQNAGQVVLVAGWWLGLAGGRFDVVRGRVGALDRWIVPSPGFCLDPWPDTGSIPFHDPPDESSGLLRLLAEKARAGVDVRVLGWVSPAILRLSRSSRVLGAAHVVAINTLTLRSLRALRAGGVQALPNTIAHLAGSSHSKIVLVSDGRNTIGFTGGIDLELSRWSRPDHAGDQVWHDVVAMVEGPAVQSIHDHFRSMWEANRTGPRRSFRVDGQTMVGVPPGTAPMPARVMPVLQDRGSHQVQALRTLPAARYLGPRWLPTPRPLSEAPSGLFGYRDAIRRAIASARRYAYVEDPLLWSAEVMGWLNQGLRRHPSLEVIMVTSGRPDPHDPALPHRQYLCEAVNHGLLAGLGPAEVKRVAAFRRAGVVVHAKTVVVDDLWACIGSANIAQRSLYTDIEHGVSFVDPDGDLVARYRARLWAHHLGVAPAEIVDLEAAIALWRPGPNLCRIELPVPENRMTRRQRRRYETINDCDSRRRWSPRLL